MLEQDRRLEVSEAAWRVIVQEGLDRTSIRAIAHEMGCTTGVVTHYFRNKQELILFALHQVTDRLLIGMEQAIEAFTGVERLAAMLSVFLPLDRHMRDLLKVWIAFLGYAVGRDALMFEHQNSAAQLRSLLIQELENLQAANLLREDLNPKIEANALLALVNGLSLDYLIQTTRLSLGEQQFIIQRYIHQLLVNTKTPETQ